MASANSDGCKSHEIVAVNRAGVANDINMRPETIDASHDCFGLDSKPPKGPIDLIHCLGCKIILVSVKIVER